MILFMDRKQLIFRVGIDLSSFCVGGRHLLDFIAGDGTCLDFSAGIGI